MLCQERFCYVSKDMAEEFKKYDTEPQKWLKQTVCRLSISGTFNLMLALQQSGVHAITKVPFSVDVGYEKFLAPEIFFHPEVRANMRLSRQFHTIFADVGHFIDIRPAVLQPGLFDVHLRACGHCRAKLPD